MPNRALTLVVLGSIACGAAGCGGHPDAHPGGTSGKQRAGRPAKPAATSTRSRHGCLGTPARAQQVRFAAPGERLDATVVGTGQVGVVLANQTENVACQWAPLAHYLAARGYRVLGFDYGNDDQSAEVQAAARYLRDHGALRLVLIGASIGGAVVIDAAVHLHPAPVAVVSLSAVPEVTSYPFPRDAQLLLSPVFQIGGTQDPLTREGKETRALYRASPSPGKRLLLLPGVTHGVDFVGIGAGNRIRNAILKFIQAHARGGPNGDPGCANMRRWASSNR